ncbi:DUF4861 domain-containing protein [Dysgonomonas sp. BGC7]|uniref:DUF4861 domain-containing protein n=1 Tax=Dysgonomonas sp. BGC7 TaxID=1658008 RepID=UPI00068069AE|nr:DUF4861 domain-containing protein [Dysgonomonas sp. BGC7]MBD8387367.1 DUF4861 domain-containing protein [Dysgonomonas sp. BGC7]
MKNIYLLLLAVTFMFSCSTEKNVKVTVENPSNFDRLTELVEIPIDTIKGKIPLTDSLVYVVKTTAGEVIPSQATFDRKIIFQPQLKANESKTFIITTGEAQKYESKTYGRLITERKDDFAWENDRVAFRAYGPALIAIDGPSNGFDVWYKRTNELVIDKWYKDDLAGVASYHNDNGGGLDDYKVGHSLGAGAMAPFINNKLLLNENFASEEILDNGPLRTTFQLTYKDLDVNGNKVAEKRIVSLDAGSQLSKVVQAYTIKEPMDVAAGFSKREKGDSIISQVEKGYLVYAEPKTAKVEGVYLGLVFPQGFNKTEINSYEYTNPVSKKTDKYSHVLGVTTQQPNIPVTYYTGYGWAKFGFPTLQDFEKYLENFSTALKEPLKIKY